MKGLSTFAFAAALLSTQSEAINLYKRTDGPPQVVGFPVQRREVPDPLSRDRLRRRTETVQATLDNEQTLYFVNATLGTPAQKLRLHLDTGSSDLWVNTPSSAICRSKGNPCSLSGTYTANSSSTYSYIASNFNISYVDGSGASGDYVSDTFTIGSTKLSRLQFGIGYNSSSSQGILGIGYQVNEVQVGRAGGKPYNNLPAQLVANKQIRSNAYSLWLNDLDASTGRLLFGGVDTSRYHGSLETLPIQKSGNTFREFLITLTDVSLGSIDIASDQALAVLLDSGSSLTYLPDPMTEAIYQLVQAQYDTAAGAAYVPCSLAYNSTTLDFTFSSPTISVPMNELVIPVTSSSGRPATFADGTEACLFGISPAGSSTSVLGDTFMRSAYLVYDLSNNEISIAQTNFNATSSHILEIGTGTASVPDASPVPNAVSASAGLGSAQTGAAATTTSTSTSKGGAQRTPPPMKLGAMAVGAGVLYAAM